MEHYQTNCYGLLWVLERNRKCQCRVFPSNSWKGLTQKMVYVWLMVRDSDRNLRIPAILFRFRPVPKWNQAWNPVPPYTCKTLLKIEITCSLTLYFEAAVRRNIKMIKEEKRRWTEKTVERCGHWSKIMTFLCWTLVLMELCNIFNAFDFFQSISTVLWTCTINWFFMQNLIKCIQV